MSSGLFNLLFISHLRLEYKQGDVAPFMIVTTRCLCPLLAFKINKTEFLSRGTFGQVAEYVEV